MGETTTATMTTYQSTAKRPAGVAGLDGKTIRPVKRRASKACQCCRSRKVRCNVIEHGAPCTNCRLDEVPCIVTESKRKRKSIPSTAESTSTTIAAQSASSTHNGNITTLAASKPSKDHPIAEKNGPTFFVESNDAQNNSSNHVASPQGSSYTQTTSSDQHVPHSLYARHSNVPAPGTTSLSMLSASSPYNGTIYAPQPTYGSASPPPSAGNIQLPYFIKPLPTRIGPDETAFLIRKSALSIPSVELRNELLRAFVEFVHPYMPILDLEEFLRIVDRGDGSLGRISLLLFQAVMYAGCAMVDTAHLRKAGYSSRKEARKAMYLKARLLYDFDYEIDRVSLLQSLLLLTNWYESPDDQKDSWHWMGNAISLAHTIGLNRDPTHTSMEASKQKQWRRMWWCCVLRDRLIALGMRRPTRVKSEDHNVPPLTMEDFDLKPLPEDIKCITTACRVARDVNAQKAFAHMYMEKCKLALVVSHVLQAQYSLPELSSSTIGEAGKATSNLVPKKTNAAEVQACHDELQTWFDNLPADARLELPWKHTTRDRGLAPLDLNRAILHMVYYTTLSALHRPQVLAETRFSAGPADMSGSAARERVRRAADKITQIACGLLEADLVRFLPTTGVTVLQPAIISHLLDIKAPLEETQTSGLQGFCQCVQVMSRMRSVYAAADYSLALIEAAVRKADIHIPGVSHDLFPRKANSTEDLIDAGLRRKLVRPVPEPRPLTPPPDHLLNSTGVAGGVDSTLSPGISEDLTDGDAARRLGLFLASTPPQGDTSSSFMQEGGMSMGGLQSTPMPDLDREFESLINLDDFGDAYTFNAGGLSSLQGESSGFTFDMDWLHSSANGGLISRPKSGMSMFESSGLAKVDEEPEDDDDDDDDSTMGMGDVKIPI